MKFNRLKIVDFSSENGITSVVFESVEERENIKLTFSMPNKDAPSMSELQHIENNLFNADIDLIK